MPSEMSAAAIVEMLGMKRHPEGGWYAETLRDAAPHGGRATSTAIYFLLEQGDPSNWHRLRDTVEVWHYHAGAPIELTLFEKAHGRSSRRLGSDLAAGERPQAIVPADWWQTARSLGDWTLVGCTVAPGFEFSSFELAPAGWEPG